MRPGRLGPDGPPASRLSWHVSLRVPCGGAERFSEVINIISKEPLDSWTAVYQVERRRRCVYVRVGASRVTAPWRGGGGCPCVCACARDERLLRVIIIIR